MKASEREQIDRLLQSALDRAGVDREAFLTQHCPAHLRAALDRMLATADADDTMLRTGGPLLGTLGRRLGQSFEEDDLELIGSSIGPYRVVEELGRGGMAVVYRAARVDGEFEQQVAIKLIKRGTDTDEVLRRFRQERQILAALDHPGIARLLDGGVSQDGRPYFVIEPVLGLPIDRYCDDRAVGLEGRLALVLDVCAAVAHAHTRLVVHRDIKPSNILVDQAGRAKLLDFGIAKLLDPDPWVGAASVTQSAVRVLTPEYASPEQIRGEAVTTATDVYQLGLLLYELLCGRRPFRVEGADSRAELERRICDEDPRPPSKAALKEAGGSAGDAASHHRFGRRLAGDLDTIVLKALRKDVARRYDSVAALRADLERFLAGRPVTARPLTMGYRVRKLVQRHRWAVASAVGVAMLVVGLTIAYTTGLARARDRAEGEAVKATRVASFLGGMIDAADPSIAAGGQLSALELIDRGAARVDAELGDQPEIRATVLIQLAEAYSGLGRFLRSQELISEALEIRRQAFGPDHPETAATEVTLATALHRSNQYAPARDLYEHALPNLERHFGREAPELIPVLGGLAYSARVYGDSEKAVALQRRAMAISEAHFGPDSLEVSSNAVRLADILVLMEGDREHLSLYERAVAIQRQHQPVDGLRLGETMRRWAYALRIEQPLEAVRLCDEALPMLDEVLAEGNVRRGDALQTCSSVYREAGDGARAEVAIRDAYGLAISAYGPYSPITLSRSAAMALVLAERGNGIEGMKMVEDALVYMGSILGEDSTHLVPSLRNVANVARVVGAQEREREVVARIVEIGRGDPATPPEELADGLDQLAALAEQLGELQDAASLRLESEQLRNPKK